MKAQHLQSHARFARIFNREQEVMRRHYKDYTEVLRVDPQGRFMLTPSDRFLTFEQALAWALNPRTNDHEVRPGNATRPD